MLHGSRPREGPGPEAAAPFSRPPLYSLHVNMHPCPPPTQETGPDLSGRLKEHASAKQNHHFPENVLPHKTYDALSMFQSRFELNERFDSHTNVTSIHHSMLPCILHATLD